MSEKRSFYAQGRARKVLLEAKGLAESSLGRFTDKVALAAVRNAFWAHRGMGVVGGRQKGNGRARPRVSKGYLHGAVEFLRRVAERMLERQ